MYNQKKQLSTTKSLSEAAMRAKMSCRNHQNCVQLTTSSP